MSSTIQKPGIRPSQTSFSSGPCPKRPNWSLAGLDDALLGRSHRSKAGKAKLKAAIDETRSILNIPSDYLVGIVAGSDTGAVEMALWNLLGERGVDVLAWESFGRDWVTDVIDVLNIKDSRTLLADYGDLPDLAAVDFARDVVFLWNGTTSGVKIPNADWIPDDRAGLTICDATSAVFAMDVEWNKLDVVTFSWQKVLGGEGGHGMLILSPRAVQRLESFTPPRPLPKLFRLCKGNKLDRAIFEGATINTPSMLCVEDYLDALNWAKEIGGLRAMIERSANNLAVIERWVEATAGVDFLANDDNARSSTSMCLKFTQPQVTALDVKQQESFASRIVSLLESEQVAYDINAYRSAPPGLRIWGGATVETTDIEALLPWIEWAHAVALAEINP
ncbi:MAG: phosphoserine aminotransferase [Gammaproteobacteria bacterium]|jgi:phosphoserine aminotransferase